MTLRWLVVWAGVSGLLLLGGSGASAAVFETTNFHVEAPTPELARKFGEMAEFYRRQKALEWLGREMPPWPERCLLRVRIELGSAGGATTFSFHPRGGVASQQMEIRGEVRQLLHSVLPHEITHTVFAHYFGRPVPRWADEGGSVLSENEEERFQHDIRCREILNAGRAYVLRVLFRMTDYPRDMIVVYAQGYSVTAFLVERGGGGQIGRAKFLQFLAIGMQGNDPRYHGTVESWNEAVRRVYGWESVEALERAWLDSLRTPPSRTVARELGQVLPERSGNLTATAAAGRSPVPNALAGRSEIRSSALPAVPVLEPPVRTIRGATPEQEPTRPSGSLPATAGVAPNVRAHGMGGMGAGGPFPPPVLLPPEIPAPVRP
jgi:PAS domain-containing protein